MRGLVVVALVAVISLACGKEEEKDRFESIENRIQATEFHLATLSEIEPRLANMIRLVEDKQAEWAGRVETAREGIAEAERKSFALEERLEAAEEWIREKDKEEERERAWATPDGTISPAWKLLPDRCGLDKAGEAQTTLNFLVRIDRYMSEFPVHHPVELEEEDPLACMTSNLARASDFLRTAYRAREMTIVKERDQWLGYRIDRSWESRPERGTCMSACCEISQGGEWTCPWEWEEGRWECEYDVEGWRNYTHRYLRKCEYIPGSRDFYTKPYLMQKMEERQVDIPDKLYCVVDLVWESRIHCLSHTQYPVLEIRYPESIQDPKTRPVLRRFSVVAVSNWDVLYKDEWTSTWVVKGVVEPEFPGQQAGFHLETIQAPECCPPSDPQAVLEVIRAAHCIPEPKRLEFLEEQVRLRGIPSMLEFDIQRSGLESDPLWGAQLKEILESPCP
jgi:hypothetical protein